MKKVVMLMLIAILVMVPMIVNAAFPDVPEDHWAAQYINELSSKGVINGYTDGNFGPSDTLTNGQFLKLIITASFKNPDFSLVEADFDHWAAKYLKVAQNYNIVDGKRIVINQSNIDEPINRITVVKLMSLCDMLIRRNSQRGATLNFTDVSKLSVTDLTLLKHAVGMKVIGGYTDGTFKPENNLTRAEASKILSVYMGIQ